jgi:hypothetical protein
MKLRKKIHYNKKTFAFSMIPNKGKKLNQKNVTEW